MRHGETDWNKKKLVQGRKDIPLNEYGRHLARETSYGMRQYQIDLAYTVPYSVQKKRQRSFLKDATFRFMKIRESRKFLLARMRECLV